MSKKRKKNKKHEQVTGQKLVRFQLLGSEIDALLKVVQGYTYLVETLPDTIARTDVLSMLGSLKGHLQIAYEKLLNAEEKDAFYFPGVEVSIANDAIILYLVAASSSSEYAQNVAPVEDRNITEALVPLQTRLQHVVNQIAPKRIDNLPIVDKSWLN